MKRIQKQSITALLLIIGLFISPVWAENNGVSAKGKRAHDLKQQDLRPIVYSPPQPKAVVYLLTDMNCSYCRKLHNEIPTLVDLGVEVRVLAMPRQGIGSASYNTLVSIWCSEDPKGSLQRGMEGVEIKSKDCKSPIQQHYALGKQWGVIGTPTIVFADGTLKSGYFSATKLAQEAIKRASADH